jgi:hypothetical protein
VSTVFINPARLAPTGLPGALARANQARRSATAAARQTTIIQPGSIQGGMGGDVARGTITSAEIQAGTITADNIQAATITGSLIQANTITTRELAAESIYAENIAAGQITADLIAADAITANHIVAGTITTELSIADVNLSNAVLARLIAATNISTTGLSAISANLGTVTAGRLSVGGVGEGRLHAGSGIVTSEGTINGLILTKPDNTITVRMNAATGAAEFAGTVTEDATILGTFEGTVDGGAIVDNSITGSKLVAETITAREVAAESIIGSEIIGGTVYAAHIKAGSIDAVNIKANTITANEIDAGAITANELQADAITTKIAAGEVIQTFPVGATGAAKTGVQIDSLLGVSTWLNATRNLQLRGDVGLHLLTDRTLNDARSDDRAIDWVDTIAAANTHASIFAHSRNDGAARVLTSFVADAPAAGSHSDSRHGVWSGVGNYWQSLIGADSFQNGAKEVYLMVGENAGPTFYGYRTLAKRANRTAIHMHSDFVQSPSHLGTHIVTGSAAGVGFQIPKGFASKTITFTFPGYRFIAGTQIVPNVTATAFRSLPDGGSANIFATVTAVSARGFALTIQQAQNYNTDKNVQFRVYWVAAGGP